MHLSIIGSGVAIPLPGKNASSYVLTTGETRLVLDFGAGALQGLVQLGIDYNEVETLFISHPHPDHYADLIPLLHACKLTRKKKLLLLGFVGLHALAKHIEQLPGIQTDSFGLVCKEFMHKDTFQLHDLQLNFYTMKHGDIPALGIRICDNVGKIFAYTGDTGWSENLLELVDGVDYLLIECSYPNQLRKTGHLTPGEIGEIVQQARVKNIILTHFYPEINPQTVLQQIQAQYQGNYIIGHEGLQIDF